MFFRERLIVCALLFTCATAHALITSDRMSVKILKAYDKNVLVLNRGLEDGVVKGDHIKITSDAGFIARGICLKASMLLSHWKIYRVVRPELVSKDTVYQLHSMNQSAIPEDLERLRRVDFSSHFTDISDKDLVKEVELQQERLAKYDLPNSIQEAKSREPEITETQEFIGRNFNATLLEKDLKRVELSVFAAPISWESLNEQRNMYFGFHAFNHAEKYAFELRGEQRDTKVVNRFTKEEVEKFHRRGEATFRINQIAPSWSYFAYGLYEQERQGSISRNQTNFGPVGFTKHLLDNPAGKTSLDLSFAPLFDYRQYEAQESQEHSNARLSFHMFYSTSLSPAVSFKTDFWWQPYLDLAAQELDFSDTRTNFRATLSRNFTETFSVEYQFQYLNDMTYEKDLNTTPENMINTINFRLTTDL